METLAPIANADTIAPPSQDVAAQVFAALQQPVPPDSVRQWFGLSVEQFREIIREQNQAVLDLLHAWQSDDSGYEEEQADAIERALIVEPLSLREVGRK